jgi:hypothetical protein
MAPSRHFNRESYSERFNRNSAPSKIYIDDFAFVSIAKTLYKRGTIGRCGIQVCALFHAFGNRVENVVDFGGA